MAKALGIGFVIGATVSSTVASAFSTVEGRLQQTRKSLGAATREARTLGTALELRNKRDQLAASYKASGGKDDKTRRELEKVAQAYRKAKTDAVAYGAGVSEWGRRHEAAARQLEASRRKFDQLTALHEQAGRRKELRGDMMGTAVQAMSLAAPVKMAINFESAMADAAKTIDGMRDKSGSLTTAYYDMEAAVKRMGRTLPLAHEEIARLFAAGGQQGLTAVDDLEEFSTLAAHMSVAFGMSTEEAADAIGGYRSALKLTMPEARSMLDLMNQFANTTSASEKGIADVVRRIGPLGNVGGVAAKPMTALAATLDAMKVSPEIAATGIKNLILAMTAGSAATKTQRTAFARLGIDTVKLARQMQTDGPAAIISVLGAIKKLPKAEQLSIMQQIFGRESLGAITPLLDSLDQVKTNLIIAGDEAAYAGAMQAEFENRSRTTANAMILFKNKSAELAVTVGSVLLPPLNEFMSVAGDGAVRVAEFAQAHPALTRAVIGAVAGFVALKVATLGAMYVWSSMRSTGIALRRVYGGLRGAVAAYTLVTQTGTAAMARQKATTLAMTAAQARHKAVSLAVAGVTRAVTAGQWLLNAALTANPIGIVVMAVAALIAGLVYLYNTCEPVRAVFDKVFGWIGNKISTVVDKLRSVGEFLGLIDEADKAADAQTAESGVPSVAAPVPAAEPMAAAPQAWTPPSLPSSGMNLPATGGYAAGPAANGVGPGISLNFSLNGMPDRSFAQGVVRALQERSGDIEAVIARIVHDQARLAYGR